MRLKPIKVLSVFACIIIALNGILIHAQNYNITGKISDANTGEPIPFATVILKNTASGTTTDFEGRYVLKVQVLSDSLKVQVIGYQPKSKCLKKGKDFTIDFQLNPTSYALGQVEVFSGENPAYRIVREAIRRRQKYNSEKLPFYQHESYTNIDVSVDQINDMFRNSKLMKPFAAVFDTLKSQAGEDGKGVLPFFTSEMVSAYFYSKSPELSKEVVKAVKLNGVLMDDNEMIQNFLGVSFQKFNFYNNYINVLDRSFITPAANGAMLFYDYYIMDTVNIDGNSCFELKLKPLNKQDLAFNGRIWISDSTFAIKRIAVEIGKQANLNWVERYRIDQTYVPVCDSIWMPSKTRILIDMVELTKNSIGMIGVFDVFNSNFIINEPKPVSFFDKRIVFEDSANDIGEGFWGKERSKNQIDTLRTKNNYMIIDTIKANKKIKALRNLFNAFFDGYYRFGGVEAGMWSSLFGYNSAEGFRLQLNIRTNEILSRRFMVSAYWAYGFGDKRLKYNLQTEFFISRKHWSKIGFQYKKDLEKIGITDEYAEDHGFLDVFYALSTQFADLKKNAFGETYRIWFESDFLYRFNEKIMFSTHSFYPQNEKLFPFSFYKDNNIKTFYRNTELAFITRYSAKETRTVKGNLRVGVGATGSNVFTFIYAAGLKNIFNGDFSYHKFSLRVERRWKLGIAGKLFYSINATKIFGQIPYTLSEIPPANESWLAGERTFNKMKYFEFVADQSVQAIIKHHFEGFILNRIPLLNRLKLREVVGINLIWGSFSDKNMQLIPDKGDIYGKSIYRNFKPLRINEPYIELSYGLENIFKFLRIEAIHRMTYLDSKTKPFGIRGSIFVIF